MENTPNQIEIAEDHAAIVIVSRRWGTVRAVVDLDVLPRLKDMRWSITGKRRKSDGRPMLYAVGARVGKRGPDNPTVTLSRHVLQTWKNGHVIDHVNGDTLDNRRANLRDVSHHDNVWNRTSPTMGCVRRGHTYAAHIVVDGVKHKLGKFPSRRAATAAYQKAAEWLHRQGTDHYRDPCDD